MAKEKEVYEIVGNCSCGCPIYGKKTISDDEEITLIYSCECCEC